MMNKETKVQKNCPIHHYGPQQTVRGWITQDGSAYKRPGGSYQLVFDLVASAPCLDGIQKGERLELELYVPAVSGVEASMENWERIRKLFQNNRHLEITCCRRHDQYINRFGLPASRSFWFVDGLDHIRPLDGQ